MFRFPSVICTRCTGFFCLAIIKGPPNDIYCIIEEPYKHYFTEKVSYSQKEREEALYYTPLEYISQYFLLFPQHNFEVRHAADHIVRLISTPGHR